MPRRPLDKVYRDFIAIWAREKKVSSYALTERMHEFFSESRQNEIGQPVPVQSTVQRIRKEIIEEREVEEATSKLIDNPWQSKRIDIDGISDEVADFITTEILTNRFIMKERALSYPKLTDHLDAVTRRTAMWIQKLFNRLKGEDPLIIWSIAWMYSANEMTSEKRGGKFDARAYDYYVALKPWASEENHKKYQQAVDEGDTLNLNKESIFYVLHRMQIQSLLEDSKPLIEGYHKQFIDSIRDKPDDEALKMAKKRDSVKARNLKQAITNEWDKTNRFITRNTGKGESHLK